MPEFNEDNIQKLFGHEAAEDEDPNRLREYYFKNVAYQQITSEAPVRVLVGHKGIGKSALFKVAMAENLEQFQLTVSIQPNDIRQLPLDQHTEFLDLINAWTEGIAEIIARKVFDFLGVREKTLLKDIASYGGNILEFLRDIFQLIETDCSPEKRPFIKHFLEHGKVHIYIDDLDRGWEGRKIDVRRISALINAVRDISSQNRGLYFKLALRSDVYYLVRTSDESTDKVESSVIWHTWTNHQIFVLLIKRIETFYERQVSESELLRRHQPELASYLDPIIEPRFSGRGHWANAPMYRVMMSLIRKRPRDLVKLCTLAARQSYARGSKKIETRDFEAIFEEYSQGRIQDTINEYRSELPTIEKLIMNMKPNKEERQTRIGYVYSTPQLLTKVEKISSSHNLRFSDGKPADKHTLAAFMYKINFLTARKDTPNGIVRKYFEENRYLNSSFVDFGFDWEVHPAYRWALQPTSVDDIYSTIHLSADNEFP
jgi:hypothetical protein